MSSFHKFYDPGCSVWFCVFQAKYKEASKKQASTPLYHRLPETLETQHAKEASQLQSQVNTLPVPVTITSQCVSGQRHNHEISTSFEGISEDLVQSEIRLSDNLIPCWRSKVKVTSQNLYPRLVSLVLCRRSCTKRLLRGTCRVPCTTSCPRPWRPSSPEGSWTCRAK